jgi:hypothetical protein
MIEAALMCSLSKATPLDLEIAMDSRTPLTFADRDTVAPADLNHLRWVSHCRGLVEPPVAGCRQIRDGHDPKQSVAGVQRHSLLATLHHCQLLAQGQILKDYVPMAAQHQRQAADSHNEQLQHGAILAGI